MITKDTIRDFINNSCPTFREKWNESDNADLHYVVMGDLARHLLDLYSNGKHSELKLFGLAIEEMHVNGDNYVREFASIGILETVQNVWDNEQVDSKLFRQFLGPISLKWWNSINRFWTGEIKYVGEDIK
jgi:hypothetical protein